MTSIARPDIVDRVLAAAADRARELVVEERRLIAEDAVEVGEPELLDEDARGVRDDGDPDGSPPSSPPPRRGIALRLCVSSWHHLLAG